ncbi:type VI secretion system baseplate subunit TssE [Methylosinus sporium]|uniref:type VI secretion system baseplate subunit TssE n=1 Tax=Methylosinus sporium TaxID=428 RepID=UPI00383BD8C6
MAESLRNRVESSLMHCFRTAHAAKDMRTNPAVGAWRPTPTTSRAGRRVAITESALKDEVAQHVEALLNCVAVDSTIDLERFPRARRSVLNYGFPSIARLTIDELERSGLESEIERTLRSYEPRLIAATLQVTRDRRVDPAELTIRYVVHAELASNPLPLPMEFIADVEVTTGKIQIQQR